MLLYSPNNASLSSPNPKQKGTSFTTAEWNCFKLWIAFLTIVNKGISINNVVYYKPDHIRWDDSWPIGIRGVSISGRAYRYHIPRHLQGRISNNTLEFLASVVWILLDIEDGNINAEDCILAMTDNSSAQGWLHKSNFVSESQSFHVKLTEN